MIALPTFFILIFLSIYSHIVISSTIPKRWATLSECKEANMGASTAWLKNPNLDYMPCPCDTSIVKNTNPLHFISNPLMISQLINNANRKAMINQQSPQLGSPLYNAISQRNWILALEFAKNSETDLLVGKESVTPYSILPKHSSNEDPILTELRSKFTVNPDVSYSVTYNAKLAASAVYFSRHNYNTPDKERLTPSTQVELDDQKILKITQKEDFNFLPFKDYLAAEIAKDDASNYCLLFKATKAWEIEYLLQWTKEDIREALKRKSNSETPFIYHLRNHNWESALAILKICENVKDDVYVEGGILQFLEGRITSADEENAHYILLKSALTPKPLMPPPTQMIVATTFGGQKKRDATEEECLQARVGEFSFDPSIIAGYEAVNFISCSSFSFKKICHPETIRLLFGDVIENCSLDMIEALNRNGNDNELLFLIEMERWGVVLEILKYSIIERNYEGLHDLMRSKDPKERPPSEMEIMNEILKFLALKPSRKLEIYTSSISLESGVFNTPEHYVRAGDVDLFRHWLEENYLSIDKVDKDGNSLFYQAILNGREDFVHLIIDSSADPSFDHINRDGQSALHLLSMKGMNGFIEKNERLRSFINMKSLLNGCTPLHLAIDNGNTETVRILLALGADVRMKDMAGRGALDHCKVGSSIYGIIYGVVDGYERERNEIASKLKRERREMHEKKIREEERMDQVIERKRAEIREYNSLPQEPLPSPPSLPNPKEVERERLSILLRNFVGAGFLMDIDL